MQFRGPSYETPAEVQMARIIGASLIGMSTALEAIAAREAGMDILGISLVTNLAAGISPEPLSHEEVLQAGKDAGPGSPTCWPRRSGASPTRRCHECRPRPAGAACPRPGLEPG